MMTEICDIRVCFTLYVLVEPAITPHCKQPEGRESCEPKHVLTRVEGVTRAQPCVATPPSFQLPPTSTQEL